MTISLADQLACALREVRLRQGVYPRLVAQGKMTQRWATFQITAMQAIATTLEGLLQAQDTQQALGLPPEEPHAVEVLQRFPVVKGSHGPGEWPISMRVQEFPGGR